MITLKYNNLETTEGTTKPCSGEMLSSPSVSHIKDDNMETKKNIIWELGNSRVESLNGTHTHITVGKDGYETHIKMKVNGELVWSIVKGGK